MTFEEILGQLTRTVPEALGAIVCDFEGETVVSVVGGAPLPRDAEARAMEHVPKRIPLEMPIGEFLIRLAGAEPCSILRHIDQQGRSLGAGGIRSLHARYESVEVLVDPLPSDYYLVLVLKRPALAAHARFELRKASLALQHCL